MQQLYLTILGVIFSFAPFLIQSSQKNQTAYAQRKAINQARQEKALAERIKVLNQYFDKVDNFKLCVEIETQTNPIRLRNLPKANISTEINNAPVEIETQTNPIPLHILRKEISRESITYPGTGEQWERRPRLYPQLRWSKYFLKQNGVGEYNYNSVPGSHSLAPRKKSSDNKITRSPYKSSFEPSKQQFYSKNRINKNATPKRLKF